MSTKQKIVNGIELYFSWLRVGQEFNGLELANHSLRFAGCPEKYPDTVFRYLREMRKDGRLNFECISNPKSRYKKLACFSYQSVDATGQTNLNI